MKETGQPNDTARRLGEYFDYRGYVVEAIGNGRPTLFVGSEDSDLDDLNHQVRETLDLLGVEVSDQNPTGSGCVSIKEADHPVTATEGIVIHYLDETTTTEPLFFEILYELLEHHAPGSIAKAAESAKNGEKMWLSYENTDVRVFSNRIEVTRPVVEVGQETTKRNFVDLSDSYSLLDRAYVQASKIIPLLPGTVQNSEDVNPWKTVRFGYPELFHNEDLRLVFNAGYYPHILGAQLHGIRHGGMTLPVFSKLNQDHANRVVGLWEGAIERMFEKHRTLLDDMQSDLGLG